jgi:AraC family transcriptional regulator
MTLLRLPPGECFGSIRKRVLTPGFTLALMHPDRLMDVGLHTHDTAHVIVHLGGTYISTAAGAPVRATGPLVVCNPPGTTHRDRYARTGREVQGHFLNISMPLESWKACRPAGGDGDARCLTSVTTHRVVIDMLRVWVGISMEPEASLEALCVELLGELHPVQASSRRPPAWLQTAREMLRDTTTPFTVRDVARACGIHSVALARTFRRWEGCSPVEYGRRHRVIRAATMLGAGETPSGVAAMAGFADQSHLTHSMRSALGITPGAYRALLAAAARA